MSDRQRVALAEKRALLAVRAELDRARVTLAVREIKAVVAPDSDAERTTRFRPVAAMLISVLAPAMGTTRVGRWLRVAGIAMAAVRVVRSWK